MKEFNVGQTVVITDNGDDYTTYRTMAIDVMKLSNWHDCTGTPLGVEVKIIAKSHHIRTGVTLYGVEDEFGKQYVVGGQYFKPQKPTRTEYVKVESCD